MKDLIESLTILAKYQGEDIFSPTHCEHDVMLVVGVEEGVVSEEDRARLKDLGWVWHSEYDAWGSFRFGSA